MDSLIFPSGLVCVCVGVVCVCGVWCVCVCGVCVCARARARMCLITGIAPQIKSIMEMASDKYVEWGEDMTAVSQGPGTGGWNILLATRFCLGRDCVYDKRSLHTEIWQGHVHFYIPNYCS